jgi:hypothetical protein
MVLLKICSDNREKRENAGRCGKIREAERRHCGGEGPLLDLFLARLALNLRRVEKDWTRLNG